MGADREGGGISVSLEKTKDYLKIPRIQDVILEEVGHPGNARQLENANNSSSCIHSLALKNIKVSSVL